MWAAWIRPSREKRLAACRQEECFVHEGNLPIRYKLSKPVRAVKLQEHPGSSLRNPTETLVEIPANVIVELEGAAAPSGLSNILWAGEAFSVFYEDLNENGQVLDEAES